MISFDLLVRREGFTLEAAAELDDGFTGVFGPSGSGKSTLLAALAGLARPERGFARLGGEALVDAARGVHVPPHRRGIGLVFQEGRLFPHLSVRRNLLYGARRGGAAVPFDEMVELLAIGPLLERRPAELSGGERQRVALGRALTAATRLLLLDEPLAALDRPLRAQILPYLARVRERVGVPVLHVSHDLSEILQLTDRLLLLRDGRTVGAGSLLDLVRAGHVLHGDLDNVLALEVARHDPEAGLTCLRAPVSADAGAELAAPPSTPPRGPVEIAGAPVDRPPGAAVHVGLRPEDVVLALRPVPDISARNQLAGTVRALVDEPGRVLALVDAGCELFVEVTPGAVRALDLRPGREVVCLFKANALRYLDAPPGR